MCYIVIYMFMQKYTYICWIHTDVMIKTQEDFFNTIYLSLYCKGSKRLCGVLLWEGAGDRTYLQYFDPQTYGRQRCVFLVLLMLNRSPGVHSAGCWLSLLHIISIFSGPQFIRASRGPLRPGVAFLTTSRLQLRPIFNSTGTGIRTPLARRTQLSYIIVRRPLDLWNRMFNRHQAEITVMQFRGHSLPVHQSMSVPWEFF